ncbi:MAG TPA: sigma-70 family RNA polymerase sigma factor [Daejeonella sp.]|uniref:RNA polymerase sigma factor n=1 Tax=Daejeonella sp. TaxID=2805397 RepID=UPI0026CB034F|nr:sigma-70 family RNA polymerase sigma factor [Daejeonella sp.]HQS52720.1 sigma-70 family RNA polymerase sigma factor [Daejeonella sp.]HQT21906.1 sigma-70 family RNA polymerase sigma factor [Daejeonella sp.]HQT57213.1 sigma-70 family RNA polymerase sigma factor [Daejeonella sp.]
MRFNKNSSGNTVIRELELLAEYRSTGDLELLGKLYEQYMPLVFGLCLKYFRDEEQSKDAVMQIFEELVKKLRVHEVTNFKSWLYTLSRNHCLMVLRSSSKHEMLSIDENFMENEAFVHLNLEDNTEEKLSIMAKCIEDLPSEQKVSINLFYMEQKCYKEVADHTGFELNKVKSYIQNGKRNLKICIEKNSEH